VTCSGDSVAVVGEQNRLFEAPKAVVGQIHRPAHEEMGRKYPFLVQFVSELADHVVSESCVYSMLMELVDEHLVVIIWPTRQNHAATSAHLAEQDLA
jgi:hypothetical protein